MSYELKLDAMHRSGRATMNWYHKNLMKVLRAAKERRTRHIDETIKIAEELIAILDEKCPLPTEVPLREVVQVEGDSLMRPVEPEVLDIFYKSTEYGGADRYLAERYKKSPEDRYFFRLCTSWDYGWQHKASRVPARSENRGRCAILRDTFYRKNNLGPDPRHYSQPSGGEISICSMYSCQP